MCLNLFKSSFEFSDLYVTAVKRPALARGLTPPTLDQNVHFLRCLAQLRSKDKDIEKNIYLSQLKDADPSMFYKLCLAHMSEITPLIYTPTVGDACLQYSQNYRRPEGLVSLITCSDFRGRVLIRSTWHHSLSPLMIKARLVKSFVTGRA